MDFPDWLLVAIGLAVPAALLLGPIAFFRILGLPKRLVELEKQLGSLSLQVTELHSRQNKIAERLGDAPARSQEPQPLPEPKAAPASAPLPPEPVQVPKAADEPVAQTAAALPPRSVPEQPLPQSVPEQPLPPSAAPPRQRSLEERLGASWTVWVGGIALALGALLLVRYSIENGLIGPFVRIVLGLALAAFLVLAGEVLRRRDDGTSEVPAVLTAAGTVAAFGAIYAAHALYGFIGPGVTFAALGATGLFCMLLAGLHGPWLGALGLVGSLAVPLLVESRSPDPWTLVVFVGVVCATAYTLARVRSWMWLALAGLVGAGAWGVALAAGADSGNTSMFAAGLVHDTVHIILAGAVFGLPRQGEVRQVPLPLWFLASTLPSLLLVPALLTLMTGLDLHFGRGWVVGAAVPLLALTLLARTLPVAAGAFAAAALAALAVAALWPDTTGAGLNFYLSPGFYPPLREFPMFLGFCAGAAGVIAILAAGGLFGGPAVHASISLFQGGTACLLPLAMLALVWFRLDHAPGVARFSAGTFAAWAGGLALVDVALATALRRRIGSAARLGLGCFAAASIAALALGLVFLLDRGMLTVALALAAAGTALVAARLQIPALRWCVAGLGLLIAARLAWDPRIAGADLGKVPVFNWLLYGYGVPALCFVFAAWLLRREHEDFPLRMSQALAIVFSALLVFFEIRHALNGGDAFASSSSLVEQGLFATSSLGFAIVTTRLDMARAGPVFRYASLLFGFCSFATTLVGLCLMQNPFWTDENIEGGRVFNAILLAYALPGAMALFLSRLSRGVRPQWYRLGAGLVALVLLFATASLEVRRWFMDSQIGFLRGFQDIEWYSYSLVWLAMGMLLLAYGIWRASLEARLVSGLFVLAAVFKIFLFDLAGLDGILRALSFIGLGFVLIGIGLVYQKLVFKRPG